MYMYIQKNPHTLFLGLHIFDVLLNSVSVNKSSDLLAVASISRIKGSKVYTTLK